MYSQLIKSPSLPMPVPNAYSPGSRVNANAQHLQRLIEHRVAAFQHSLEALQGNWNAHIRLHTFRLEVELIRTAKGGGAFGELEGDPTRLCNFLFSGSIISHLRCP